MRGFVQAHPRGVLPDLLHPSHQVLGAEVGRVGAQGVVQRRPADATPLPRTEQVVHVAAAVAVADAGQPVPHGIHAQAGERGQRTGHEPLAARLVHRPWPGLDHHHAQACPACLDGRGEAHRAAAHHEDVDLHRCGATVASARSSAGMRKPRSSTALSTVNATAVTHAVCTRGRASPSTTTAT